MRILVLVSLVLLGVEVPRASLPNPHPAELLSVAVEQFQTCKFDKPVGRKRNDNHQDSGEVKEEKQDNDLVKKLSIPILFRNGRFRLEDKGEVLLHRRQAWLVNFSPLPDKDQLKRVSGEDRDIVKVLNQLSGSVYIDQETGRFIQIEARLSAPYDFTTFKKIIPLPVTISEIWFSVKSESGEGWQPNVFQAEFDGHGPVRLGKPKRRHEHYTVPLRCTD
jgi:hypothetical protein